MKHTTEKNIRKLKEVEVLISQGLTPPEASRQSGISIRTYYRYRQVHGRMRVDQVKRLIKLEKENKCLKNLVEEKGLDIQTLKEKLSLESIYY